MLHGPEGSVWGGGEGEDSLPEGAHPRESQRPPEGKGEDHETSAAPGPTREHEGATDPQPQTALRLKDAPDSPESGHHPRPEEPSAQKGPFQEVKKVDTFFSYCCM